MDWQPLPYMIPIMAAGVISLSLMIYTAIHRRDSMLLKILYCSQKSSI